ncbi:MAG: inositol monophosphatase [Chitinivibrionales bacterium]|nr:inositol monophosphatase [Chitinivibrionales bacterium]
MREPADLARQAAQLGGKIIRKHAESIDVRWKGTNDLVTQADIESEKAIRELILQHYPHHRVLGEEESPETDANAEHVWIIDPLDGTTNYAHGIEHVGVSVAYARMGEVVAGAVLDVFRRQLYSAAKGAGSLCNGKPIRPAQQRDLTACLIATGFYYDRGRLMEKTCDTITHLFHRNVLGIRRTGTASLDLCWVACGKLDAYFEYHLRPWDYAAGMLIVQEAGGVCLDRMGNRLRLDSLGVVVTNAKLAGVLMEVVGWDGI